MINIYRIKYLIVPAYQSSFDSSVPAAFFGEWAYPHQAEFSDFHATLTLISCLVEAPKSFQFGRGGTKIRTISSEVSAKSKT